ncbi:Laminin subunit beta-2 [Hondaea fermentalgiana]|uniref:Laminin subunit beta-2 n=1 Tax=Hondaea fermentalgiana TaxID=2315210 RepID=A0A2R5G2Y9_9STRA|nr:Laminin subunit beta-2 [Hondaea fermentalgiana]|eukprot:GBG24098.1 Laminin subunit beta-2 [Hondaea fermentalgiana]
MQRKAKHYISAQKQNELHVSSLKAQIRAKDDQLKQHYQSIKQKSLARNMESKELRLEVRRLQARLLDMESQMGTRLKVTDMEREKSRVADEKALGLNAELVKVREAERRARRDVENMASRLSAECAKTTSLSEHLNRALEESKVWERKCAMLSEQEAEIKADLESANAAREATHVELQSIRAEVEVAQASLAKEQQVAQMAAQRNQEIHASALAQHDANLAKEKQSLTEALERAQKAQRAAEEDRAAFNAKLNDAKSTQTTLERAITDARAEVEARRIEVEDAQHARQTLEQELETARNLASSLENAYKEEQRRTDATQKALANAQEESAARTKALENAQGDLAKARAEQKDLEETRTRERKEFALQVEQAAEQAKSAATREGAHARAELESRAMAASRDAAAAKIETETTRQELDLARQELDRARQELKKARQEHGTSLERISEESKSSLRALQTRAESWRVKAENAEKALERKEHEVRLARGELARHASELERLAELQQLIERKGDQEGDLREILLSVKEQLAAHKALLNLRLLLKSAEATDAVTHLEFARVKEKNLEQQLQVLVYNVTACESHMTQCDPIATQKQQLTRTRRLEKLESQLKESATQRDDYLRTSQTNRDRLSQLLRQAETRLALSQSETLGKLPENVKTLWA